MNTVNKTLVKLENICLKQRVSDRVHLPASVVTRPN